MLTPDMIRQKRAGVAVNGRKKNLRMNRFIFFPLVPKLILQNVDNCLHTEYKSETNVYLNNFIMT